MNKNFFFAVTTITGTIVGVGIFALPYVIAQVGFWIGMGYMFAFACFSVLTMSCFLEIELSTKGIHHQLPDYAGKYLGKTAKIFTSILQVISQYGVLLAYIIISGKVLHLAFGNIFGGSEKIYGIIFTLACSIGIYFGVKAIKKIQFAIVTIVAIIVILIFAYGAPSIDLGSFGGMNLKNFFIPFGVVLFAFEGSVALTMADDILSRNKKKLKYAAITAVSIALVIYILFVSVVIGVVGVENVSEDSIASLATKLGWPILAAGTFLTICTVTSAFFTTGYTLSEVYRYDYKMGKNPGWILMVAIPLGLYALNLVGFATLIGFIGAIFVGSLSIISLTIYTKLKKKREKKPECAFNFHPILIFVLIAILVVGAVSEIWHLIAR